MQVDGGSEPEKGDAGDDATMVTARWTPSVFELQPW